VFQHILDEIDRASGTERADSGSGCGSPSGVCGSCASVLCACRTSYFDEGAATRIERCTAALIVVSMLIAAALLAGGITLTVGPPVADTVDDRSTGLAVEPPPRRSVPLAYGTLAVGVVATLVAAIGALALWSPRRSSSAGVDWLRTYAGATVALVLAECAVSGMLFGTVALVRTHRYAAAAALVAAVLVQTMSAAAALSYARALMVNAALLSPMSTDTPSQTPRQIRTLTPSATMAGPAASFPLLRG
jgi:hypothetical protein